MVQQDKDVLDETLQSNQETFTSISDGGKDRKGARLVAKRLGGPEANLYFFAHKKSVGTEVMKRFFHIFIIFQPNCNKISVYYDIFEFLS